MDQGAEAAEDECGDTCDDQDSERSETVGLSIGADYDGHIPFNFRHLRIGSSSASDLVNISNLNDKLLWLFARLILL
jgi:hypothetical protein